MSLCSCFWVFSISRSRPDALFSCGLCLFGFVALPRFDFLCLFQCWCLLFAVVLAFGLWSGFLCYFCFGEALFVELGVLLDSAFQWCSPILGDHPRT